MGRVSVVWSEHICNSFYVCVCEMEFYSRVHPAERSMYSWSTEQYPWLWQCLDTCCRVCCELWIISRGLLRGCIGSPHIFLTPMHTHAHKHYLHTTSPHTHVHVHTPPPPPTPSHTHTQGGGTLALVFSGHLPPGKKWVSFTSTQHDEYTVVSEAYEENPMALTTIIPSILIHPLSFIIQDLKM